MAVSMKSIARTLAGNIYFIFHFLITLIKMYVAANSSTSLKEPSVSLPQSCVRIRNDL